MTSRARSLALAAVLLAAAPTARAQTRTGWEMNDGEGVIMFPMSFTRDGDPGEYAFSRPPAPRDSGWRPAPDVDTVNYDIRSTLCDSPLGMCHNAGQFTYFRTTLCIPDPRDLAAVRVHIASVDDGARLSVFNSAFPTGISPPGSVAFLGATPVDFSDFTSALRAGEPNVLLLTHVDDCCTDSALRGVAVRINGRDVTRGVAREVCNGLDDDCNGLVDDGFGDTRCGMGACARAVTDCLRGVPQTCVPGDPTPELCNGIDDDCDGLVDDHHACGDDAPEPAPEPMPEPIDEIAPDVVDVREDDVALDVPDAFDAGADACRNGVYRCDPGQRLEGRAGPIGACLCSAPGAQRGRGARAWIGWCVAAVAIAAGRRRRERDSSA